MKYYSKSEFERELDRQGYELLKEHGYDVADARKSRKKRRAIKEALAERGEKLVIIQAQDEEKMRLLVWCELRRGEEMIGRSRGITVPVIKEEEKNGKQREDSENQERFTSFAEDNA